MADSSIDLAAPAGLVDARTEATDSKKRQVICIADPSTKTAIAPVTAANGLAVDVIRIGGQAPAFGEGDGDATTLRVRLSDDSPGVLEASQYEDVAASTGPQMLGGAGAAGDYLSQILVIPTSVSPGALTVKDGALTAKTIFAGGANSLSNLVPFTIACEWTSVNGGWQITTLAGLSVRAAGRFTT
jgi:hypothetical protein